MVETSSLCPSTTLSFFTLERMAKRKRCATLMAGEERAPKRICARKSWSELDFDLLELVLKKVALRDVVRIQAVCSSWYKAVKSYMSSQFYTRIPPMLCSSAEYYADSSRDHFHNRLGHIFVSLADPKKTFYRVRVKFGGFSKVYCLGSSNGWLVILDETLNPHLVDPFSEAHQIQLPLMNTLIIFSQNPISDKEKQRLIVKAVVTSKPSDPNESNFKVVVASHHHASPLGLAYCKHGDKGWTHFGSNTTAPDDYRDILYHRDQLYALRASTCSVEVWGFHGDSNFPTRAKNIKFLTTLPSGRYLRPEGQRALRNSLSLSQCFMVESLGELYLVLRFSRLLYTIALYKLAPSRRRWIPVRAPPSPIRNQKMWDVTVDGLLSSRTNTRMLNAADYLSQSFVLLNP